MSSPKNRQQLVELEYCIKGYFNSHYLPIVDSECARFERNAVQETKTRTYSGWGGYIDAASPFATTHVQESRGPWNRKTTEDLLASCNKRFFSDPKVQGDIKNLVFVTKATLMAELGEKRYQELSQRVPRGDLAQCYVEERFTELFAERMAKKKAPRNTIEYLTKKGLGDSIFGVFFDSMMKRSDMDKQVQRLSEKIYGANAAEKAAAFGVSFAADAAVVGGYGTVKKTGIALGLEGVARAGLSLLPEDKSFSEGFSEYLWNDSGILSDIQSQSYRMKAHSSMNICLFNGTLSKPFFKAKYDERYTQSIKSDIMKSVPKDDDKFLPKIAAVMHDRGINVSSRSSYPEWMKEKTDDELYRQSCYWTALACQMSDKGLKDVHVNGRTYSLAQVSQRGLDYARAYMDKVSRYQEVNYDDAQQQDNRPEIGSSSYAAASVSPSQQSVQQTSDKQPQSVSNVMSQSGEHFAGWSNMLEQSGLGSLGDVGKNLGYVLAMLPDVLIGMFTGKNRNLKFSDNMLPIASVVAGMFVRNPLLKMLLVGFGGASLLGKAGREALENRDGVSRSSRPYRQYADEALDIRIKDPVMKGNTLIASIDNNPCVITINDEVVDAYYKGAIPLNVLSNAVLRRYDEQKEALQENFERTLSEKTSEDVSRGIK